MRRIVFALVIAMIGDPARVLSSVPPALPASADAVAIARLAVDRSAFLVAARAAYLASYDAGFRTSFAKASAGAAEARYPGLTDAMAQVGREDSARLFDAKLGARFIDAYAKRLATVASLAELRAIADHYASPAGQAAVAAARAAYGVGTEPSQSDLALKDDQTFRATSAGAKLNVASKAIRASGSMPTGDPEDEAAINAHVLAVGKAYIAAHPTSGK